MGGSIAVEAPLSRNTWHAKLHQPDVRFGSLADIRERLGDVRFTPKSRHGHRRHQCLLSAISRHPA
jgi:hypothetical protein